MDKRYDPCRTKIVATLGPSSSTKQIIISMIKKSMSVARLNLSHGTHAEHKKIIQNIRRASEETSTPIAILLDLSGPKIRLGDLSKPIEIQTGQILKLGINKDSYPFYTDFAQLLQIVKKNERILIDDGFIELKVIQIQKDHLECQVIVPGTIKSKKGINLPDVKISIPVFTQKDKKDLIFGLTQDIDFIAMSFVNSAQNIVPVKKLLKDNNKDLPVIAKIERPMALKNIKNILEVYDGIMIARGDLGVEMAPEKVPIIQKDLIKQANYHNKLVITATQMLESMIHNPRPTRAEASDVSNAILDGSDLIMLSGETSVGKYPIEAISMMHQISKTTESSKLYPFNININRNKISPTEAIVKSASEISADLNAKFLLVYTLSGKTALLLSKYRPSCPIYGFTPYQRTYIKMAAYWGLTPKLIDFTPYTDKMLQKGENCLRKSNLIKKNDLIISIAGITRMVGATNMLRISIVK